MTINTAADLNPPVHEHDHIQGPPSAEVTLVEYGDYECPHCGTAYWIIQDAQARLGDSLRFVYRNFPLTEVHPHAEIAAEAAEAAGAQGKFWEMHDLIYEHQQELDAQQLVRFAGRLGLDADRFEQALQHGTYRDRVRQDFVSGVRSGVNGTPTFFINGLRYDGPWQGEELIAALEAAIAP